MSPDTDGNVMSLLKSAIDVVLACDCKEHSYHYVVPDGMIASKEILSCIESNAGLSARRHLPVNPVDEVAIRTALKEVGIAVSKLNSMINSI